MQHPSYISSKKVGMIFLLLSLLFSCTTLRIYVPQSNNKNEGEGGLTTKATSLDKITVHVSYEQQESFAVHNGSWFRDDVQNATGSIEKIIKSALHKTPELFVKADETLNINIRQFKLFSDESFNDSYSSVVLQVDISRNGEPAIPFEFHKTIESSVSDSMAFLSTITIVGWIIYAPYIGFRGTLEDQLNYLGRLALAELFKELTISQEGELP